MKSNSNLNYIPLKEDYLPFLDGFRGIAALWVIASHTIILSGALNVPVLRRGDIAVDLFMIMSGFLMAYHYYARQAKEPWERPQTWVKFYIRRFFRIAPLYYVLFALCLMIGPSLGVWREGIAQSYHGAATDTARYSDQSLENILMHVSFLFGLSPAYSFRTPMPDWSIGLEMQFYFAFPFLMLLFRRNLFFPASAVLFLVCRAINHGFADHAGFYKPSFLPMSLHFFLIGMLLATYNKYKHVPFKSAAAVGMALILAWYSHEKLIIGIAALIILLLNASKIGQPAKAIARIFGNKATTWLADMSYSAYLLHLAFMTPIGYLCTQWGFYLHLPGRYRMLILFVLTVIPTYLCSTVLFHTLEKNGILWGKRIVANLREWAALKPQAERL